MPSTFKKPIDPESAQRTTFNTLTANLAGAVLIALEGLPPLGVALLSSNFNLSLDHWDASRSALGALAVLAAQLLAHVPAGGIWARVQRRDRAAFVLHVLAPALTGSVIAAVFAAWTLWPVLAAVAISLDDIWTAAIALGLPAGGAFDEVRDGNGKRWIEAAYPGGRKEYYEPRL